MTQLNHTPTWTEKHLRYCIAQRLTPTAIKLYQWLLGEMREGYAETIDLRDFQKMVAKERGKAHDFRVVQEAIKRLVDAGILRTIKRFTNFVWKWTVRPINRLIYPIIPKPKKPQSRSQSPSLDASNAINSFEEHITTTTYLSLNHLEPTYTVSELLQVVPLTEGSYLEQNLDMCEQAGIKFSKGSNHVVKLLSKTHPEKVMGAVDYCVEFAQRNEVKTMQGLFIDALRKDYKAKNREEMTFSDALATLCSLQGIMPKGVQ